MTNGDVITVHTRTPRTTSLKKVVKKALRVQFENLRDLTTNTYACTF
jgi:hypothetical protein